jgi:nucleotide-binding universal stress UspA family protein
VGTMAHEYRILVGIDGSAGGRAALTWAAHEAATRGGTVQAVTAYRRDDLTVAAGGVAADRGHAERLLAHELDGLPAYLRSGMTIATEAVEGRAAQVLTAAAADADVLVLGSHGHGRLQHTVLGSVSEECIRLAICPVVVIPSPHEVPHAGQLVPYHGSGSTEEDTGSTEGRDR